MPAKFRAYSRPVYPGPGQVSRIQHPRHHAAPRYPCLIKWLHARLQRLLERSIENLLLAACAPPNTITYEYQKLVVKFSNQEISIEIESRNDRETEIHLFSNYPLTRRSHPSLNNGSKKHRRHVITPRSQDSWEQYETEIPLERGIHPWRIIEHWQLIWPTIIVERRWWCTPISRWCTDILAAAAEAATRSTKHHFPSLPPVVVVVVVVVSVLLGEEGITVDRRRRADITR